MAARLTATIDATQYDLLTAIETRLREECGGFRPENCFICDGPVPMVFPPIDPICTITVGDGIFDQELYSGGGPDQLCEDCPVLVSVMARASLDTPPASRIALLDPNRGLILKYKPLILRAMLVDQICDSSRKTPWIPRREGQPMLRDGLVPVTCTSPRFLDGAPDRSFLGITLRFDAKFDWRF